VKGNDRGGKDIGGSASNKRGKGKLYEKKEEEARKGEKQTANQAATRGEGEVKSH